MVSGAQFITIPLTESVLYELYHRNLATLAAITGDMSMLSLTSVTRRPTRGGIKAFNMLFMIEDISARGSHGESRLDHALALVDQLTDFYCGGV